MRNVIQRVHHSAYLERSNGNDVMRRRDESIHLAITFNLHRSLFQQLSRLCLLTRGLGARYQLRLLGCDNGKQSRSNSGNEAAYI